MDNVSNFETFLLVSNKKLVISVNSNSKDKIYYEELLVQDDNELNSFKKLDIFLKENIFKIEKKIQNFIEKIVIILDMDVFFNVEISLKKNNHNDYISIKSLKHLLYEANESCKKTIDQKKIIHLLINNYQVDKKNYPFFPEDIKCQSYSLDLRLICISQDLMREIELILKRYHISLKRVVCASYVEGLFSPEDSEIFSMTKKIINGHNPNEVFMKEKTLKNEGFFEKFFNFFN